MKTWLLIIVGLVLMGTLVPYMVLGGSGSGWTVALFWMGFGLVVALIIGAAVSRWEDSA